MQSTIRKQTSTAACPSVQPQIMPHTTLWANNPDVTASLQFFFGRSGLHLSTVTTAEEARTAAIHARPGDFLIIDCTATANGLERCTAIVTQTDVPVYICHPDKEFVDDLQVVASGDLMWLSPAYAGLTLLGKLRLLKARPIATADNTPHRPLTPREQEVLRLVALGLTNPRIAERLCVSESTVKTHIAELKRKLDVTTRAELVAAYHRPIVR